MSTQDEYDWAAARVPGFVRRRFPYYWLQHGLNRSCWLLYDARHFVAAVAARPIGERQRDLVYTLNYRKWLA